MKLPSGYRTPVHVYVVESEHEDDGNYYQVGAFLDETEAEACRQQLEAEGFAGLVINHLTVHSRLKDWEWDR